jgi:hypothetical protein
VSVCFSYFEKFPLGCSRWYLLFLHSVQFKFTLILKMEAIYSSEILVSTLCRKSEDCHLNPIKQNDKYIYHLHFVYTASLCV